MLSLPNRKRVALLMDKNRRGESGHIPFRTGRFFSVGGEWFFTTREGRTAGRTLPDRLPRQRY